jgi:Icc-related predicted phosphoesterase
VKILHLADLHLQHDWFDWVASHDRSRDRHKFDLIVIAGDLQDAFSNTPMHDQARAISKWMADLRPTPIVVCSGNHDFWTARGSSDPDAEGGWIRQLKWNRMKARVVGVDGEIIEFHGFRIAVNGWLQVPAIDGPIDILVTHAPPAGCDCSIGAEGHDVGDPGLWDALKYFPPTLTLCGHVHQPRRKWCRWPPPNDPTTLVLVLGCDENSAITAHWIIDTDQGTARHSSGWRTVRLG